MTKRRHAIVIAVAGCIVLALAAARMFASDEDKGSYQLLAVSTRPDFIAEYRSAQEQQDAWIQNPHEVAFRFVAHEECGPPRFKSALVMPGMAIFVVADDCGGDDSVAAHLYRLELAQEGDNWEIVWSGEKHRCRSSRMGLFGLLPGADWQTAPCP